MRTTRAFQQFRAVLANLFRGAPPALRCLAGVLADAAEASASTDDIWAAIRGLCEDELQRVRYRSGTLAHAVEWEAVKLQARIRPEPDRGWPSLLKVRG